MPDLTNRSDEEAELAYLLMVLFQQYRGLALTLLGDQPSIAYIPPGFYADMQRDIDETIRQFVERIHREAALRMADGLGFDANAEAAANAAAAWAAQRAAELSQELVARIQQAVSEAVASLYVAGAVGVAGTEVASLGLVLGTIWSAERAERIARNEITEAVSAGEIAERDEIEALYNVTLVGIWNTEEGACEICAPLEGEPEEVWGRYFPEGPPGPHVGCQCFLTWEVE